MDIVGSLVGGQGCAADGTTAARNPLSRLVDTLMEGSAGGQPKGRSRRPMHHNQGGAMMRAPPPGAAAAAAHAHAHAQGFQEGPMRPMERGRWIGPGGGVNASHHPGQQGFVEVCSCYSTVVMTAVVGCGGVAVGCSVRCAASDAGFEV